jgi:hypothetical protein
MGIPQGVRLGDPIPLATELPITPPFQAGQQRSSQRPDAPSRYRFRLTALLSTGFQLTLPLDDSERDPLARRSA